MMSYTLAGLALIRTSSSTWIVCGGATCGPAFCSVKVGSFSSDSLRYLSPNNELAIERWYGPAQRSIASCSERPVTSLPSVSTVNEMAQGMPWFPAARAMPILAVERSSITAVGLPFVRDQISQFASYGLQPPLP
jgi:hypothetical protein